MNGATGRMGVRSIMAIRAQGGVTALLAKANGITVVTQQRMATPKPVWNPDVKQPIDFLCRLAAGARHAELRQRLQVAMGGLIRHVAEGAPYRWDLLEGAKGVQLVECAMRSWKEPRCVDLSDLPVA